LSASNKKIAIVSYKKRFRKTTPEVHDLVQLKANANLLPEMTHEVFKSSGVGLRQHSDQALGRGDPVIRVLEFCDVTVMTQPITFHSLHRSHVAQTSETFALRQQEQIADQDWAF